ncbi:MAG: hypothetical protein GW760_05445 [Legionella sp.]|nr:hypothetical protein [Legionella sp.]
MKKQKLTIEIPPISDEAAASLQRFLCELLSAVDEYYYCQIHRDYLSTILIQHGQGGPTFKLYLYTSQ